MKDAPIRRFSTIGVFIRQGIDLQGDLPASGRRQAMPAGDRED
jgi:hypothetical protein